MNEHDPNKKIEQPGEPLHPSPLLPELAEFLQDYEYACVTQATDQGTVFVLKAPARDIASTRGPVPVHITHELYMHEAAPVIRIVLMLVDDPTSPLAFETFVNVADEQQRADYAALITQDTLLLLFYDESLTHRLSKRVQNSSRTELPIMLNKADAEIAIIGQDMVDFEVAKSAVMERINL